MKNYCRAFFRFVLNALFIALVLVSCLYLFVVCYIVFDGLINY